MPTITVSNDSSISHTSPGLLWEEFLPIVETRKPSKEEFNKGAVFSTPSDDEGVTLNKYLDNNERKSIQEVETEKKTIILHFTVKQGADTYFKDEDGYIEPVIMVKDEKGEYIKDSDTSISVTSKSKSTKGKGLFKKYGDEIELKIEFKGEESKEFYIDFYANDNEDNFEGDLENVHCGRVKVSFKVPNEWEFTKDKIDLIKAYALKNTANKNSRGGYTRYHHCTDTHKYIALKLLKNPKGLDLGKDQSENRGGPQAYESVGESSTRSVRKNLINKNYAERSKTFTVLDVDGIEVLNSDRTPGNTDKNLSKFKNNPIDYMANQANTPSNGYYVFIGAYNDDYHSFTIVLNKLKNENNFLFIDQYGIAPFTTQNLENHLLRYIHAWKSNFPMMLELYQLKNNNKDE